MIGPYLGTTPPTEVYLGAAPVVAIYVGTEQVWPSGIEPASGAIPSTVITKGSAWGWLWTTPPIEGAGPGRLDVAFAWPADGLQWISRTRGIRAVQVTTDNTGAVLEVVLDTKTQDFARNEWTGTLTATPVFKDGDYIRFDAYSTGDYDKGRTVSGTWNIAPN